MSKDSNNYNPLQISGQYAQFNYKLMRDERLTWAEKAYYIALLDRSTFEDQGWSFQKHETMLRYGFDKRYSKDLAKSLHDKGFIRKKRSKHGFVTYPLEFYLEETSMFKEKEGTYMKIS